MQRIAIFASGRGSNARKIIEFFESNKEVCIDIIVSNNSAAGVLDLGREFGIDTMVVEKKDFYRTTNLLTLLKERKIDLIVLAGFLWLVPSYLVQNFHNRVINIHPALLPKYGGKGMYGANVHKAVCESGEKETGITVHFVNEKYDEGAHIFKATCSISQDDSPKNIADKVLLLEHNYYPKVIQKVLKDLKSNNVG